MDRVLPTALAEHPGLRPTYRPNVAAIIRDDQDRILWCERVSPRGTWQFPQGGIDEGETAEQALWRELHEELGLSDPQGCLTVEGKLDELLCYDFPVSEIARFLRTDSYSYIGQGQQFFLLRFHGDEEWLTLEPPEGEHQEFVRFAWSDVQYLQHTAPFKREVTRRALAAFDLL